MADDAKEEWKGPPVLVCWYSGGFTVEEGRATLHTLQSTLRNAGVRDQLVLDHSNEYGFTEEGYEPWPRYVDKLVQLIDKAYAGRSLILFGHSKGTCPAMSVASRLGERVLKVYVAACAAWLPGRPTPWEKLSRNFKKAGDQHLLAWFASLNPGKRLLESTAFAAPDMFEEMLEGSAFLKSKLTLMRLQYRDAMYPDMSKGTIKEFPAEFCAVSPLWDGGSQPFDMMGFRKYSRKFEMWEVHAGHGDVLSNEDFLAKLSADILRFSGAKPAEKKLVWEPSYWDMPRSRVPPPVLPSPGPTAPRLSHEELDEVFKILNPKSSSKRVEVPGFEPPQTKEYRAGTTYTVKVDIGKAGEQEDVTVDLDEGPLLLQPDGSSKFLKEVPTFSGVADGAPAYGPGKPSWTHMTACDQKVLLDITARLNKSMHERILAAAAKGQTLDGNVPDFLKHFEPRSKDREAEFWKGFRFERSEEQVEVVE